MKKIIYLFELFMLFHYSFNGNSQVFTCGQEFTDTRDGQIYNTIQIGNQCWMKNNLNIGIEVFGTVSNYPHSDVSNNGIIEKYCFSNDFANCKNYGGLYDWDEAMNYSTIEGIQGICPDGWHIPTESEWFVLEQFVDSTILINTIGWNRGIDGGTKLKQFGSSGFDALLGGNRNYDGVFNYLGSFGWFWTSSNSSGQYNFKRAVGVNYSTIYRDGSIHSYGFSIRCITYNGLVNTEQNYKTNKVFSVYPNPVTAKLNIDTLDLIGKKHIEIFDISGKINYKSANVLQNEIDVSMLKKGTYFIKLFNGNKIYTIEFIKE